MFYVAEGVVYKNTNCYSYHHDRNNNYYIKTQNTKQTFNNFERCGTQYTAV